MARPTSTAVTTQMIRILINAPITSAYDKQPATSNSPYKNPSPSQNGGNKEK